MSVVIVRTKIHIKGNGKALLKHKTGTYNSVEDYNINNFINKASISMKQMLTALIKSLTGYDKIMRKAKQKHTNKDCYLHLLHLWIGHQIGCLKKHTHTKLFMIRHKSLCTNNKPLMGRLQEI
jgi:hypothetical protein